MLVDVRFHELEFQRLGEFGHFLPTPFEPLHQNTSGETLRSTDQRRHRLLLVRQ